jgi:serine/threonine-protein kinase
MGIVVAAHHLQLDEKVALKFLLPEALDNPDTVARFDREARAAVKIKSEHVARVSDVGRLENGAPYIVMEYLEGIDLSAWLKQHGPMPVEQAAEFVLQASEAVAEAHALGIVHRDLKPSNLFCVRLADRSLSIKVLDFGISKMTVPGSSADMTRTSASIGSPYYMPPEQMRSAKGVDARSDVWSLGVILFELVAGRVPFTADSLPELVLTIAESAPRPLRETRPDVSVEFEQLVLHCLEKNAARRFQNVGELAAALGRFAPRQAVTSVEKIIRTLASAEGSLVPSALAATQAPPSAQRLPPSGAVPATAPSDVPARTGASWAGTATPPRMTRSKLILPAVLFATIGGAVLLFLIAGPAVMARLRPAAPAAAESAPTAEPSTSAAPSRSPPVTASPTPPSAAPSSGDAPSVASTAASSSAPGTGGKRAAPRPTPPGRVVGSPKPDCDPPFTFDPGGRKVYKPECF